MKRKPHRWPEGAENWTLEEVTEWLQGEREEPFQRAQEKLREFVNVCVSDPDFKASPALLDLLLVLRDVLATDATEEWTIDDYMEPVESAIQRHRQSLRGDHPLKMECQIEWLKREKEWQEGGKLGPRPSKESIAYEYIDRMEKENESLKKQRKRKRYKVPGARQIIERWLSPMSLKELYK